MINSEHIRKYLDGELTPQEMQAIEKAALDDPFLADAIDGIWESRKQSVPFEVSLSDLKEKLAERVLQKERKKAIPWMAGRWQAAASVFLVITIAAVTMTLINRNSQRPVIAIKKSSDSIKLQPVIAPSVIPMDSGGAIANATEPARINYTEPVLKRDRVRPGKQKSIPAAEETDERDRSSVRRQAVATAPVAIVEPEKPVADKKEITEDQLNQKAAGVEIFSPEKKKSVNFIQGQVLDEKGKPVNGAAVTLAKAKESTTTDPEGYFRLYVKKQDSAFHLQIQSVGYNPLSAFWNRDSSMNTYRLYPQTTSLNDVVVVGYGSRKNTDEETEGATTTDLLKTVSKPAENKKVEPLMGWDAFNQFIRQNKKIQTSDSLLQGTEIISFIVDQHGSLSSLKILQSVSPAHDVEVTRLIQSVQWKILKGKKQKRIITVEYP